MKRKQNLVEQNFLLMLVLLFQKPHFHLRSCSHEEFDWEEEESQYLNKYTMNKLLSNNKDCFFCSKKNLSHGFQRLVGISCKANIFTSGAFMNQIIHSTCNFYRKREKKIRKGKEK